MTKFLEIGEKFWNIRGSFKLAFVELGTHASLVELQKPSTDGKKQFILLDSIKWKTGSEELNQVNKLTDNGKLVKAIVNLHPFHTIYAADTHRQFPEAKLYGTRRHHSKAPDLPWEPEFTESEEFKSLFEDDIECHVPKGVYLVVPGNENIHCSSVVVYHKPSKTVHVDDTFTYLKHAPLSMGLINLDLLAIHPTLSQAYEPRAGAGADFTAWLTKFCTDHTDIENLCAAHTGNLLSSENKGKPVSERLRELIPGAKKKGETHDAKLAQ